MTLCEGSTLKPWLLALKFLPLLVLPKFSMRTNLQLQIPSHLPYRILQSLLQKPVFEPHISSWPFQPHPNPQSCYWTTTPHPRHAWATVAAPSARVHRVSTPTACQRHALAMPEASPSGAPRTPSAQGRASLSATPAQPPHAT